MIISPIPINKILINNISLNGGQFIYCLDTKEVYYDNYNDTTGEVNRIGLANTVQLNIESERSSLSTPEKNIIYIVVSTNRLYRYINNEWIELTDTDDCKDLLYNSANLKPITIVQNNIQCAPMTLASQVYTSDGSTAQDFVNKYLNGNKKVKLNKKTFFVEAGRDMQRIYTIPYPTSNYDLTKFPMVIAVNNKLVAADSYAVSDEQIIFEQSIGDDIVKGDIIKFIFAWTSSDIDENRDGNSLDNRHFEISPEEPTDPKDGDFWFDMINKCIKYWDASLGEWVEFVNNKSTNSSLKKTITIYSNVTSLDIGIADYDHSTDTLMVYKDGKYLDEYMDYNVSENNKTITATDSEGWGSAGDAAIFTFIVFKNITPSAHGIFNELVEYAEALLKQSVNYIVKGECESAVVNDTEVCSKLLDFFTNYMTDNTSALEDINTNEDDPYEIVDILTEVISILV